MHCSEGERAREQARVKEITCRCHSAATFLCISHEKNQKTNRKVNTKTPQVPGKCAAVTGPLERTPSGAKVMTSAVNRRKNQQHFSVTWETGRGIATIYARAAVTTTTQGCSVSLSLSVSLALSLPLSLSLLRLIALLYMPHSFSYSRYRVSLVRCRLSSSLILPVSLSPSLSVSLFLLPISLLPSACPWSISRSRGTINCVTNATWQLKCNKQVIIASVHSARHTYSRQYIAQAQQLKLVHLVDIFQGDSSVL